MGYSQGREYAELPWAVDMMIAGLFGLVILQSVHDRAPAPGADPVRVHLVCLRRGDIDRRGILPGQRDLETGQRRPAGHPDAILLWFYGHNIFGLLLTPLALGVAYYVLPLATRSPFTATPCP
jgi:cytochrome c oxidase cbb3-type subunit 1